MNNLDLIIEKILSDANLRAEQIIGDAEQKAEKIKAEGERMLDEKSKALTEKAERTAREKIAKAEASAALSQRNAALAAKLEVLDRVFEKVEKALNELPQDRYLALLKKLLKASLEDKKEGIVLLNKTDAAAIGERFIKEANDMAGNMLTLGQEHPDISGGFILRHGEIEINCSTSTVVALFREKEEKNIYGEIFPCVLPTTGV